VIDTNCMFELHEDLVEELEDISVNPLIVKVVKGLDEASALLLSHSDEIILKETIAFMTGASFNDSDLKAELERKILAKLPFTLLNNVLA
jgi:hypothetical protein